ncbi:MAG TPA: response regulator transcription factor [Candidatus Methylomirabilis sp.]|nr:response regulator transcription factor [Candidatus Methylomirabilis sp.]
MIRILIVDDHSIVRRALKQIVTDETDMTVVGEAGDAEGMLAFVRTQACDVVVMDISMPGRSGLEALKELIPEHPTLPVLVLSMHSKEQYGVQALQLGAAGYLTKDSAPEELVNAIRQVVTRRKCVGSAIAELLAFNLSLETEQPVQEMLSKGQHEVLCLIASGKSYREIAAEFVLRFKTVNT